MRSIQLERNHPVDSALIGVLGSLERALWSTGAGVETRSLAVHVGYYFFCFPGSE